jgi:hypothetical protein
MRRNDFICLLRSPTDDFERRMRWSPGAGHDSCNTSTSLLLALKSHQARSDYRPHERTPRDRLLWRATKLLWRATKLPHCIPRRGGRRKAKARGAVLISASVLRIHISPTCARFRPGMPPPNGFVLQGADPMIDRRPGTSPGDLDLFAPIDSNSRPIGLGLPTNVDKTPGALEGDYCLGRDDLERSAPRPFRMRKRSFRSNGGLNQTSDRLGS